MAKKTDKNLTKHIQLLNMNGLRGRVLEVPPPTKKKNKQILLVYGHHASIERMIGFAEELNRYGAVTLPDLPGFGGMESYYKIGVKPSIDNLADYLAAFIKMRYKHRRLTIIGMSFGFVIVTRMLQKYPDIVKKVDDLISIVGFVHHEDFKIKSHNKMLLKAGGSICTFKLPAFFTRYVLLSRPLIYLSYLAVADNHVKMKDSNFQERLKRIRFEVDLWHSNEVRTYAYTGLEMLRVDLCSYRKNVPLKVAHVKVDDDRYFDNRIVEQHLGIIYKDVEVLSTKLKGHAPTVLNKAKDAAPFIPRKIRTLLKQ